MDSNILKNIIKQRFEKSFSTYEQNAVVQCKMAQKLVNELIKNKNSFSAILEIGAGTGVLTKNLLKDASVARYYANDITENSELYIKSINSDIDFIKGDAQGVEFPSGLDLVVSNAAIQWVEDFPGFVQKVAKSLNQGGIFAFTTFGVDNLCELKPFTEGLKYLSKKDLEHSLEKYFDVVYSEECTEIMEFSSPKEVLKHLKGSGVNSFSDKIWTKSDLKKFESEYKKNNSTQEKVHLSYNPIYFVLIKK